MNRFPSKSGEPKKKGHSLIGTINTLVPLTSPVTWISASTVSAAAISVPFSKATHLPRYSALCAFSHSVFARVPVGRRRRLTVMRGGAKMRLMRVSSSLSGNRCRPVSQVSLAIFNAPTLNASRAMWTRSSALQLTRFIVLYTSVNCSGLLIAAISFISQQNPQRL